MGRSRRHARYVQASKMLARRKAPVSAVTLRIDKHGAIRVHEMPIRTTEHLFEKLAATVGAVPPVLRVRVADGLNYEIVGKVIFTAMRAGLQQVKLVRPPRPRRSPGKPAL